MGTALFILLQVKNTSPSAKVSGQVLVLFSSLDDAPRYFEASLVGKPAFLHAMYPPTNAAVFVIPFSFNLCAARALECSVGQEQ